MCRTRSVSAGRHLSSIDGKRWYRLPGQPPGASYRRRSPGFPLTEISLRLMLADEYRAVSATAGVRLVPELLPESPRRTARNP